MLEPCGEQARQVPAAATPAKAPPVVGHEVRLGAGIDALRLFDAATERAL